ncbi:hypothetical protein [Haliscomenobacter sp.]|uniref:hypothetical protein n=1 Tax=Haliscomenobacter sp. TaxID=2717303 RepID=UPI003593B021
MTNPPPPRLHVILATQAPVGIVIRRGPSKQFCTLLWNRKTDSFTMGQWLKGRIYEHRSDLSPDGKHFLYFAMNARRSHQGPTCWTAISRAPYLRAIALYGDEETWFGGGLFLDNKTYFVNGGFFFHTLRESKEVVMKKPDPKAPVVSIQEAMQHAKYPMTGDLGVYCDRLERDGWSLATNEAKNHFVFEKPFGRNWMLRSLVNQEAPNKAGKSSTWSEYSLLHFPTQTVLRFPDWEWADIDRSRRLVWASKGQIWAGQLNDNGLRDEKMLYDFNDMRFEAIKAPYD